ncbi:MAG: lipoyl protein ligase domain-containing protein [Candidatus Woesearchaeota archaeon]
MYIIKADSIPVKILHLLQADFTKYLAANYPSTSVVGLFECQPTISFGSKDSLNKLRKKVKNQSESIQIIDKTYESKLQFEGLSQFSFVKSQRGGGSTYVGPGQRTVFFFAPVQKEKVTDFDQHVNTLIQSTLEQILDKPIAIKPKKDALYIDGKSEYKIASKGLRFQSFSQRQYSQFGCSFYVQKKGLTGFEYVTPCGFDDLHTISCEDVLGRTISLSEFDSQLYTQLAVFEKEMIYPTDRQNTFQKKVEQYLHRL